MAMEIREIMQALDEDPSLLEELRARILTRELLEMPENLAKLTESVEEIAANLSAFIETSDRRFDRLGTDIGVLRGWYAEATLSKRAIVLANRIGNAKGLRLRYQNDVDPSELMDMATPYRMDIGDGDLESFCLADLVFRTQNADSGEIGYVAVEASYTCDSRDVTRVLRNVGFLERFTGAPAYGAVLGVRKHSEIDDFIEAGKVCWHQLDEPR